MSTPSLAPRPTPTMMDIGVARPSAQGQAMISTATAAMRPWAKRGSGPISIQVMKDTMAIAITTGTNHPDTSSASRWMGARDRCASATIRTICDSIVSRPTLPASMTKPPVWFIVPPMSLAPTCFVTGMDSPVIMDSSTELRPSRRVPSTGIFSPGRTRSLFPTTTASRPMSSSVSSALTRRAVFGARSSNARIAPPVCSRARSSRTCPSRTSTVMTAAASKYTATVPSAERRVSGNAPGMTVPTTLYIQATPVPMAIRVNMFKWRVTRDCQPRSKKGQPAQITTGVARTICIQFDVCGPSSICRFVRCPPISSASTGRASMRPTQNLRCMSMSSSLGPS